MVSYDDVLLVPLSSSLVPPLTCCPRCPTPQMIATGRSQRRSRPTTMSWEQRASSRRVTVRELLFSRARFLFYALTQIVSSPLLWSRSRPFQAQWSPAFFRRQEKELPFALCTDGREFLLGYCGVGRRWVAGFFFYALYWVLVLESPKKPVPTQGFLVNGNPFSLWKWT